MGEFDDLQVGKTHPLQPAAAHSGRDPGSYGWRPWRVGRSVGRTIYDADEQLVGVMDSPELAAQVVAAVNLWTTAEESG